MTREENDKRLARLKNIVLNMPEKPGSYQFYDKDHVIIYVGKAKKLKSRVSTYFHKEVDRFKTKVLVSKIEDISYSVVNSEEDALLLENALIKKYNPRYNVLLKDGKTYPSICMTNEYFPRIKRCLSRVPAASRSPGRAWNCTNTSLVWNIISTTVKDAASANRATRTTRRTCDRRGRCSRETRAHSANGCIRA